MKLLKILSIWIAINISIYLSIVQANTLDIVRNRGFVICGATTGLLGFSSPDSMGIWRGLDIDLCHAIAAAIFGDANRFRIVPLNSQQRFIALQSSEIDVLTYNTSVTQQRDTTLGIVNAGINFYDERRFIVPRSLGIESAKELDGATICIQSGISNGNIISAWARSNNISYKPVIFDAFNETVNAFSSGRCDAFSTDSSGLASIRISKLENPDDYLILPEIISKEPLGPFVRQGDDIWRNIVRWSLFSTILAEELEIDSSNIDIKLKSYDPNIKYFLGEISGSGSGMNLNDKWAYNIIKQVGNYKEIFNRNIGQESPLNLERGLNELWINGGLMYAPPLR